MYPVSEAFLQAVQGNTRKYYWTGKIITAGGVVHSFDQEDIVKGSGYITAQCCGNSEIELGAVYAAEMGISLFLDIDRYTLEDAEVELSYHLRLASGAYETVPMGIFEVSEANRTVHVLELKAYDRMLRFDRAFNGFETIGTAYGMMALCGTACGVELEQTQAEIEALPNGSELLSIYPENDIETYRDVLYFTAQVLGGFFCVNRAGKLEFRQYGETSVMEILQKHRFSSSFSDFVTRYTAVSSTNLRTQTSEYYALETDDGLTMNLGVNPLLQFGLEETRAELCGNILNALSKVNYGGVGDRVSQQRDGLHGGMICILPGLFKFPDGGLLPVGVPLVLPVFLPAVEYRLMLPLIRRAAQHQAGLLPDTAAGEVEACICECPGEVQPFRICMEYVDGSILRHDLFHVGKSIQQELIELFSGHVVVFDFASRAFIIDIVRRVRHHQICFLPLHENLIGFCFCGIAAHQTMASQRPHITGFRKDRLFQFFVYIKIIILSLSTVIKQSRQLLLIKTGKQGIKVHALKSLNLHPQKLLVPSGIHRHAVVGDDVGFLLRFGEVVSKYTGHFPDAFLLGSKDTSVSDDHTIVPVDDDRIDKAKLP